jgi:3-oxoadipate enol-lactonase
MVGISAAGLNVAARLSTSASGRNLVLVHGLAQDHRIWDEVSPAFPDFTTIAYDIRGHGHTALGNAAGTITQLADDLVALLVEVGPAICVGFSLGGTIALLAATAHPGLVRGVVAVATASVVGRAAAVALTDHITVFESHDTAAIEALLRSDTESQLGGSIVDIKRLTAARLEAVADPAGYINGARAVLSMRASSVNDLLAQIAGPVLVVNGEHDLWCPRRAAEIMLEQLPNADFVEIPNVGHLITDEDPQALIATIRTWLEKERL